MQRVPKWRYSLSERIPEATPWNATRRSTRQPRPRVRAKRRLEVLCERERSKRA